MHERTEAFFEGIRLVNTLLRAKEVVIAIEEKNRELEAVFAPFLTQPRYAGFRVKVVSGGYPQGSQWQLVCAVTGMELAPPRHAAGEGIVVSNVATVYAAYQAVVARSLYDRSRWPDDGKAGDGLVVAGHEGDEWRAGV